jgi:hypothetical protein
MAKAQHISYQELIQAVADASDSDTRYGFFLGAGASVESGIPVAKVLSEKWLKTIVSKLVVSTNLCLVLVRICAKNK